MQGKGQGKKKKKRRAREAQTKSNVKFLGVGRALDGQNPVRQGGGDR